MFRRLLKSVREYKTPTLLSPLFVSMEVVVECIIPFITGNFIDEVEKSGSIELTRVLFYGALLILMASVSLAFGVLAGTACAKASQAARQSDCVPVSSPPPKLVGDGGP